ncbi:uncharacterized protein Z520_09345 [Fonsecaea multimorphosa CBS 102226]|uniref:Methyltransferase small domain-containing protein n=1 Tax=Fonsecaea multimorphosa CBS 102226 TaxID=1442371 RepID=A0A0D2GZR0_9EURO|nr:uncharacterized protein Z520_09345 [Fonsecaea multimorphosa CBS 102226]KIX95035.1 hypothetical protein Z520_09345 [Fonsecaea multimorphosa CBS 102226]OAL20680.1 hypothetical protein AYO22_08689 [Fonsecaea multimorphosa]
MPRLPPALIRQATSQNPLLTLLLRVCRDLPSARNELRWLQEHARGVVSVKRQASHEAANLPEQPGLDPADHTGSFDGQTAKLDDVKTEDTHGPRNQTQRDVPVSKTVGGRPIRNISTVPTDTVLSTSTTQEKSVRFRKHQVGGSAHLKAELRKVTVRKVQMQRPSIRKVQVQKEENIVRTSKSSKIRSPHDEGVRELELRRPSDGDLVNSEADEHAQVQEILTENVGKRSKGMPLQYIIGNQPFGNLDIICKRGVLIPRPETEMYTEKVGSLLLSALTTDSAIDLGPQSRRKFRILDLCTGTGCIALLLHSILKPPAANSGSNLGLPPGISIEILGIDNSEYAVSLAQKNLVHNISQKLLHPDAASDVSFQNVDVLALAKKGGDSEGQQHQIRKILNAAVADVDEKEERNYSPSASWDMIISNPPYIGPKDYEPGGKTEPSVRKYEPKEALVPTFARGEEGWQRYRSSSIVLADLFYWPLRRIARAVGAKLLVMEVGDSEQASRVCKEFFVHNYSSATVLGQPMPRLETWRDDGSVRIVPTEASPTFDVDFEEATDPNISDRAVVVWEKDMANWRRDTLPASDP